MKNSFCEKLNRYRERLLFTIILLGGSFLRFYRLGNLHGGLHRDESTVAMNAFTLFHGGTDFVGNVNPVYFADWGDGHTALYVWLTQLPLAINKGVITPFVSRFPQAFISVLTLVAVYFVGKLLFDKRYALWLMFFLAVCPWHICMSRWGLDANLAPGFLIFGVLFLLAAVKNPKWIMLSGLFFGLTLYSYALTYVVVPVTLLTVGGYLLLFGKIRLKNRYTVTGIIVLTILAVPQILFLLVNYGFIADIRLPFLSIVSMGSARESETFNGLMGIVTNIRQALHLFIFQRDAGEIWEIRLPWGLFYDLGRVFIVIGGVAIIVKTVASLIKRKFAWEAVIFLLTLSCSVSCLLAYPHLHRINVLYIPLIMCGAYGIFFVTDIVTAKMAKLAIWFESSVAVAFMMFLIFFWKDYCTDYKELVEAYWGIGVEDCVNYALETCEETGITKITVEKAAQWPKLLLYTGTTSEEFMRNAVFESYPIPWSFEKDNGITFQTRIDYNDISDDSIYIIYFTDYDVFCNDFELTKFNDWYVAVSKNREG